MVCLSSLHGLPKTTSCTLDTAVTICIRMMTQIIKSRNYVAHTSRLMIFERKKQTINQGLGTHGQGLTSLPICYPPSVERTTTLLRQVWTSGFLRCRSKGLEPFSRPSSQSITQLRLRQIRTDDIHLHNTPEHVAL